MSLTETLGTAVKSATYNPEAEKAIAEQKAQAEKAKETFRKEIDQLNKQADDLKRAVPRKVTVFYISRWATLSKDAGKWLSENPNASASDIQNYLDSVKLKETSLRTADKQILVMMDTPAYLRAVAKKALDAKQIDAAKGQVIVKLADSIAKWNDKNLKTMDTNKNLTPESVETVFQQFQNEQATALVGTGQAPLVTPGDIPKADAVIKSAEAETKAEKATFNLGRLFTDTLSIAGKVIASLLIVMLFLVSGMLCANDAIGRDYRYRILYFIYGGLGFPIMLIYYLYRWFVGTAPNIYRLLPIYTEQADTSLGRFFLFPFTYEEDQKAKDAATNFMKEAAELVGKTYEAPSSGALQVVKALEALKVVSASADLAGQGMKAIAPALESLELGKTASQIGKKLEELTVKA